MLHTIIGYMNSGKTLFMTLKALQDFQKGRIIYSNYRLNFNHFLINKDYLFNLGNEQPDLYNTSFFIDEAWIWADCRTSKENIKFTNFILQSSKQDTNIYLTAQENSQNDKRIRGNQHLITICNRQILVNGKFKNIDNITRILPKEIQDKLYISFKTFEYKYIGIEKILHLRERGSIKASAIFPLYNTHQKMKNE